MTQPQALYWIREDFRLHDNPALVAAIKCGKILAIYIHDTKTPKSSEIGAASKLWLHHALAAFNHEIGNKLNLYQGEPLSILLNLVARFGIKQVFWNRCYAPYSMQRDKKIKEQLGDEQIEVHSFNAALLWEPSKVLKNDGTPYKVFTPFYRKGCLNLEPPRTPLAKPKTIELHKDTKETCKLEDLALLPSRNWQHKIVETWDISEEGALKRLKTFVKEGLPNYKEGRNIPAQEFVSRLSPYLHFGHISPNQAYYAALNTVNDKNSDHFCSELGWREFSYNLLYFNQDLPKKNLQTKFDKFPWQKDKKLLQAWQKGQTGIPFVDAGMRELWQTGYMHNRVRMVVGSFLVKNLLLDWRHGEKWFWDCLVDADLANNSASWQWVAGCGADAAPYFRVFNPVLQGQKFDPHGEYTKLYVPELAQMPDKYLYNPWEATPEILEQAGVKLGSNYPQPIVDLKESRVLALAAYDEIKG